MQRGKLFKHCNNVTALRTSADLGCRLCMTLFDQIPDTLIHCLDVAPTATALPEAPNLFVGYSVSDREQGAGYYILDFFIPVNATLIERRLYFVHNVGK